MRVVQTSVRSNKTCSKTATKRNKVCSKSVSTQFTELTDGIFDRTFDQTFN